MNAGCILGPAATSDGSNDTGGEARSEVGPDAVEPTDTRPRRDAGSRNDAAGPEVGLEDTGGRDTDTAPSCPGDKSPCEGDCVSFRDNADHCGDCGNDCGDPEHGTAVCEDGSCDVHCPEERKDANDDHRDGCECAPTKEVCDDKDNDCDGEVDEGLPTETYYRDEDGDGWTTSQTREFCETSPDGWRRGPSKKWDCNDLSSRARPDQKRFFGKPVPRRKAVMGHKPWDFNCDGEVDKQRTSVFANQCQGFQMCGYRPKGWGDSIPDCGVRGDIEKCKFNTDVQRCERVNVETSILQKCR